MACVTTVRSSVRFNGHLLDSFTPTRGLRQGDPLSPYLFLFVADGLSCLIKRKVQEGTLRELHICRRAPGISHLLFADDCLMFFQGSVEQASVVKSILNSYEKSTGQLVSLGKCSIMYGDGCPDDVQQDIKNILQYETVSFEEKYLGLPIPEGCMRSGKFKPTKERFRKRATDWAEKYMSSAAKETLIKSILQSLPTYAMSVFKFPAGLLEDLTKMVRDFWWGDEENRKKLHWMSWDRLARPKYQGGVGFRDLKFFNQALLARQAWRLLQFPDSLCAQLLKARYYPSANLLDTAFIQNTSPSWQGIVYGLELLKKGIIWRIGSGTSVRLFRDNWLPRLDAPKVTAVRGMRRRQTCHPLDVATILSIRIPTRASEDFVAWTPEKSGQFTVRSAYQLGLQPALDSMSLGQSSSEPGGDRKIWDLVWKAGVPPKMRIFAWKAATNTLAVREALHRRMSKVDPVCIICGRGIEDSHHALVTCTIARVLREEMRQFWPMPSEEVFLQSGREWILRLLDQTPARNRDYVIFLLWRVWHHRNNLVHGDGKASVAASVPYLRSYIDSFRMYAHTPVSSSDLKGKASAELPKPCSEGRVTASEWSPPEEGQIKVNVDAGWIPTSKRTGIGIIARDSHGRVLRSEWKHIASCASAEEAEVLACLEGLGHLIQYFAGQGILETDCLRAVQVLNAKDRDRSECWNLYMQAQDILHVYGGITVVKVGRLGNAAAHSLASLGKSGASDSLCNAAPPCVAEIVANDVT
jgi:ribonuclease HI